MIKSLSTLVILIYFVKLIDGAQDLCNELNSDLLTCEFNTSCVYGEPTKAECHTKKKDTCKVIFTCLYCWQLPENHYSCTTNSTCKANTKYLSTCQTNSTTFCLGNREFKRYKQCNIDTGHKWSTSCILSILFGGFGVDRFYLGHWQEGVGKLFSFGGFGVWTLIDAILIFLGYLKPNDSSQYD